MIVAGVALAVGGRLFGLGPIALVCGVLIFWSGVVKIVVLHIWKSTLSSPPVSDGQPPERQP